MKELAVINPENATEEEVKGYAVREASRAIVCDADGNVGLLHVTKDSYYKLPGGGLDESEDPLTALRRECREEIGCEIDVLGEIGSIVEYRKIYAIKQVSYCYFAKVKGEKGLPQLTESEAEKGFKQEWMSYEDAIASIAGSRASTFIGRSYVVPRDAVFLMEAGKYIVDAIQRAPHTR
jgi:8-oxo-dGTP diphosphatase